MHRQLRPPLILLVLALIGCAEAEPEAELISRGSLHSLFQLEKSVVLEEPDEHPIGNIVDAAVTADGRVYLVDWSSRAVRVYSESGGLEGVYGGVGEGPGEYTAPVSVASSGSVVSVSDIGLRRITNYQSESREFSAIKYRDLERSVRYIRYGPEGQFVTAGKPSSISLAEGTGPVLLASFDSVRFLALPPGLAASTLASSRIDGLVAPTESGVVAAVTGHPTVYRFDYNGIPLDSVVLPPDVYPPVLLPLTAEGVDQSEFTKKNVWIGALAATDDGDTAVLGLYLYSAAADDWLHQIVWVPWTDERNLAVTDPCDCQLIGVVGESVVLLRGQAPFERRVEWWTRPHS